MVKYFLVVVLVLMSVLIYAQSSEAKPVIFDSDMGPDYDDVGAITMLHAFADSGYVNILATVASTNYEGVASVFSVFNTYFNRPEIPIGVPGANGLSLRDWQHWTDTIRAHYPHSIKNNIEAYDAVALYRKILARQKDTSVTIITVGFFTNLSNLLKSGPDEYSLQTGAELVQQKVKLLVSMAGGFPSGKEFNIKMDAASSQYVFTHWKTPVIFSGFEIGRDIKTGLPLINNQGINISPVRDVFQLCIPMDKNDSEGRMSWDETAVLVAVKGYQQFYTLQKGHIEVAADGSNIWNDAGEGQAYLIEKISPKNVQQIINEAIMHQPVRLK
ncbi:MAG: nucleoside hydrolase [Ferruginibacter sp.]